MLGLDEVRLSARPCRPLPARPPLNTPFPLDARSPDNHCEQMPVEMSASALQIVAAHARQTDDYSFAERFWPLLERWAAAGCSHTLSLALFARSQAHARGGGGGRGEGGGAAAPPQPAVPQLSPPAPSAAVDMFLPVVESLLISAPAAAGGAVPLAQ